MSESTSQISIVLVSEINPRPTGILFPILILTLLSSAIQRHVVLHLPAKSDHPRQSYDVISIFKMKAVASQFHFRFQVWSRLSLVGIYSRRNFDETS